MPRTKLGVTAPLLAAACYFITFFGDYIPALVLAGYVLLFEQDLFLKRSAVKALTFKISVTLLLTLIGFLPDLLNWINGWVLLGDSSIDLYKFNQVINCITSTIRIIRDVFFVIMGINAFKGKEIKIPFVDPLLAKYL